MRSPGRERLGVRIADNGVRIDRGDEGNLHAVVNQLAVGLVGDDVDGVFVVLLLAFEEGGQLLQGLPGADHWAVMTPSRFFKTSILALLLSFRFMRRRVAQWVSTAIFFCPPTSGRALCSKSWSISGNLLFPYIPYHRRAPAGGYIERKIRHRPYERSNAHMFRPAPDIVPTMGLSLLSAEKSSFTPAF